jgi:phosphoenolpyruvate-protein phosphotransferase (PTS system enzyme I)
MNNSFQLQGIGVSPGISVGSAKLVRHREARVTGVLLADEAAVRREVDHYNRAVLAAVEEIRAIMAGLGAEAGTEAEAGAGTEAGAGKDGVDILDIQIELLQDPQWETDVLGKIREEKKNAGDAVLEVMEKLVREFAAMEDEYMRARAADIGDIGRRVLKNLGVVEGFGLSGDGGAAGRDLILVAVDLSPSELLSLDGRVKGFVTRAGGRTSHAAIVARLKLLPAVVGCGESLDAIADGDILVLDGETGLVLVNPGPAELEGYDKKRSAHLANIRLLETLKDKEATTTDGVGILLSANIAGPGDMEQALGQGARGVGLLRTELLFMQSGSMPTEDEQFIFYKNVLLRSEGWPVTIRTLDIGGDKQLPYLPLPKEENPLLGVRAIRISLEQEELFLAQLKAILRASHFGKCRIMLPMISNVQEIRQARAFVAAAKAELDRGKIDYDAQIKTGIMIEVPAAAITADQLAKEADFFSIGTNDLCQYTLAVDRMNEKVKDLYDPFHPAVLRLIRYVIDQGRRHNIPVGMCGELAGDPLATLMLVGMGLDEFSMNAPSIPVIKNIILQNSGETAKAVWEKVAEMNRSVDIIAYLKGIPT